MFYAIIDAASDINRLITVAYGKTPSEICRWFIDEIRDTTDMYLSAEKDFETVDKICDSLEFMCENENQTEISDLEGLFFEVDCIEIGIFGAFSKYSDMKNVLMEHISDKPKFKKIVVPDNPNDNIKIIDGLNSELIRCGI